MIFDQGKLLNADINSFDDYTIEVSKSKTFRVKPVKVSYKEIPFDFFNHPFLGRNYISNRLYSKFQSSNLTGVDIQPNPIINL